MASTTQDIETFSVISTMDGQSIYSGLEESVGCSDEYCKIIITSTPDKKDIEEIEVTYKFGGRKEIIEVWCGNSIKDMLFGKGLTLSERISMAIDDLTPYQQKLALELFKCQGDREERLFGAFLVGIAEVVCIYGSLLLDKYYTDLLYEGKIVIDKVSNPLMYLTRNTSYKLGKIFGKTKFNHPISECWRKSHINFWRIWVGCFSLVEERPRGKEILDFECTESTTEGYDLSSSTLAGGYGGCILDDFCFSESSTSSSESHDSEIGDRRCDKRDDGGIGDRRCESEIDDKRRDSEIGYRRDDGETGHRIRGRKGNMGDEKENLCSSEHSVGSSESSENGRNNKIHCGSNGADDDCRQEGRLIDSSELSMESDKFYQHDMGDMDDFCMIKEGHYDEGVGGVRGDFCMIGRESHTKGARDDVSSEDTFGLSTNKSSYHKNRGGKYAPPVDLFGRDEDQWYGKNNVKDINEKRGRRNDDESEYDINDKRREEFRHKNFDREKSKCTRYGEFECKGNDKHREDREHGHPDDYVDEHLDECVADECVADNLHKRRHVVNSFISSKGFIDDFCTIGGDCHGPATLSSPDINNELYLDHGKPDRQDLVCSHEKSYGDKYTGGSSSQMEENSEKEVTHTRHSGKIDSRKWVKRSSRKGNNRSAEDSTEISSSSNLSYGIGDALANRHNHHNFCGDDHICDDHVGRNLGKSRGNLRFNACIELEDRDDPIKDDSVKDENVRCYSQVLGQKDLDTLLDRSLDDEKINMHVDLHSDINLRMENKLYNQVEDVRNIISKFEEEQVNQKRQIDYLIRDQDVMKNATPDHHDNVTDRHCGGSHQMINGQEVNFAWIDEYLDNNNSMKEAEQKSNIRQAIQEELARMGVSFHKEDEEEEQEGRKDRFSRQENDHQDTIRVYTNKALSDIEEHKDFILSSLESTVENIRMSLMEKESGKETDENGEESEKSKIHLEKIEQLGNRLDEKISILIEKSEKFSSYEEKIEGLQIQLSEANDHKRVQEARIESLDDLIEKNKGYYDEKMQELEYSIVDINIKNSQGRSDVDLKKMQSKIDSLERSVLTLTTMLQRIAPVWRASNGQVGQNNAGHGAGQNGQGTGSSQT